MKTLAQQMAVYNAYHQRDLNKMTHFVGVPAIILAILIPLSWLVVHIGDVSITGAMALVAVVGLYYLVLDFSLGLVTVAALLPLLWGAHTIAAQGHFTGWIAFGIAFVGGWILQLVGHALEGRRPALVDNFFQIFVAPVFLVAEALFAFGARRELKAEVEALTVRSPGAAGDTNGRAVST